MSILTKHSRGLLALVALTIVAIRSGGETMAATAAAESGPLGRQIDNFQLDDFRGKQVSLSDFAESRAVVVAFLGTQCPLAKFYGPRLQVMHDELKAKGVAFIGINPNLQDSLAEISAYARRHEIRFPILKDLRNRVADQFGATRTPEIFLLDQERIIRYCGRVDDQFTFGSGVGLAKPNEARADLRIAIDELLAGEPIQIASTDPKGCLIGRVREPNSEAKITYSQHVSRLLQKHCVKCHREGQIAPFALDNYEDAAGWGEMMAEVVREQRMPPWHAGEASVAKFRNDTRLSQEEKDLLYRWVADGCPEGDRADLPEPRRFPEGSFTEGGFDRVFHIADEPVSIGSEGAEEYRYYEVAGFDEDRWVKIAECLPGNHAVVHHIIVYMRPPGGTPIEPGSTGIRTDTFGFVAVFAPGLPPLELPDGWARLIPAHYSLVFEMHYTPIGMPQSDRSGVGLVFTEREEVKRVLVTDMILNSRFKLRPFAANQEVKAGRTLHRDTEVLSLFPHMHLRGKSFRFELVRPSGEAEILLDVPNYDFNWQNTYVLERPITIPKGSRLELTAHFDNSEANLANPDPSREVRWGRQSWDEMMVGLFDCGVTVEEARAMLAKQARLDQALRRKSRSQ